MSDDATRIAFVRARLDEDERVAQEVGCDGPEGVALIVLDDDRRHDTIAIPAGRLLAEIAGKRRTLDRCAEILSTASHWTTVESADELDAILAEQVVRDMATAFERHPDYREACRP